jgi:DHA2 family multidrug resistance protein-like MFS transporter
MNDSPTPAVLFPGGLVVSVAGLLLTQSDATSAPVVLAGGFVLMSFGGGPLVALSTNLVVGSAPPAKAGLAAGVAQTGNEFGYALGVATLGSIGTAVYRTQIADTIPAGIPAAVAVVALESIAGATAAAHSLPGQFAAALLVSAREAFTSGLHTVALVAAVLLAGVAILIVTGLRQLPPIGQTQPDQPETPGRSKGIPAGTPTTTSDPDPKHEEVPTQLSA